MSRKAEETNPALVTPEIEALADAVRGDVGPAGVERALAVFREAGSAATGTVPLSRRRRDNWRPARRRFPTRVPLQAALGVVLAGATLGGAALAAGTGGLPDPFGPAESPGPRPGCKLHALPAVPMRGRTGPPCHRHPCPRARPCRTSQHRATASRCATHGPRATASTKVRRSGGWRRPRAETMRWMPTVPRCPVRTTLLLRRPESRRGRPRRGRRRTARRPLPHEAGARSTPPAPVSVRSRTGGSAGRPKCRCRHQG